MRTPVVIGVALCAAAVMTACAGQGPGAAPTTASTVPSTSSTTVPTVPPATSTGPLDSSTSSTPTTTRRTGTTPPPATTTKAAPSNRSPRVGLDAWVTVSVATLWRSPSSPRPVDRPALRNPAEIRAWLGAMTDTDRRGLSGRADTQVLLGDRVVVTALRGDWAKVVVPNQPTPLDRRGYPGWVPLAQLTGTAPAATSRTATVVSRTAWLHTDAATSRRAVEVSFGTRLGVLSTVDGWVRVTVPPGRTLRALASDVSVTSRGAPALPATGSARATSATRFVGLPYLWAGTSGFGFDCSGLTYLVLRVHGVTIPRDAGPQSTSGTAVDPARLLPGDLLFYSASGSVHHVTMYVGSGRMVHAPGTGGVVEVIPVSTPSLAREFTGARRS